MKPAIRSLALALLLTLALASTVAAQTDAIVHAVLFYSPTCPHCELVITETLPPLVGTYSPGASMVTYPQVEEGATVWPDLALISGGRLELLLVNASGERGNALYSQALEAFQVADDRLGVPALFVGGQHLVGSAEIPDQFPGLIEQWLSQGGVDWPEFPGLAEALALLPEPPTIPPAALTAAVPTVPASALPDSTATPAPEPTPIVSSFYQTPSGVLGRLLLDPVGNTLAILVLMGMILCLVGAGLRLRAMTPTPAASVPGWLVPLLALAGLGVALYLTYVETTGDLAVCGPVGDCNAVQQSPYARLFGVIPVGMFGAAGFLGIFIAWLIQRFGAGRLADYAAVTRLGMAALGSLFMVGMTFLEPFVIGATCLWCLTAAVLISALLWISVGPAVEALDRLESGSKDQRSPGPASGPPA